MARPAMPTWRVFGLGCVMSFIDQRRSPSVLLVRPSFSVPIRRPRNIVRHEFNQRPSPCINLLGHHRITLLGPVVMHDNRPTPGLQGFEQFIGNGQRHFVRLTLPPLGRLNFSTIENVEQSRLLSHDDHSEFSSQLFATRSAPPFAMGRQHSRFLFDLKAASRHQPH